MKTDINIHSSTNGEDGINMLHKKGEYAEAATPHLIFTDMNIPGKSGFEIISEIKKDEHLKQIPVVILTSSEYPEDIMLCYSLEANAVVYKESDIEKFIENLKCIFNFFIFNPFSYYSISTKQNDGPSSGTSE